MSAELEWRMWRQLRGAFEIDRFIFTPIMPELLNVDIEQYATIEECLEAAGPNNRAFLEITGYNSLHDLPQGDVTFILGNTSKNNIEHARVSETFKIFTPVRGDLYGINAAAIALAIGYGQ